MGKREGGAKYQRTGGCQREVMLSGGEACDDVPTAVAHKLRAAQAEKMGAWHSSRNRAEATVGWWTTKGNARGRKSQNQKFWEGNGV
jgi:hypothetical protein